MGSSGVLVITKDDAVLFVDPRYHEAAMECVSCRPVSCAEMGRQSPLQAALDFISAMKPKKVAYGGKRFPHVSYRYIEAVLGGAVELLDISSVLLGCRRRKSREEVGFIKEAGRIAGRSFTETVAEVCIDVSEREFAARMDYKIKCYGADFMDPVPIIVASGERTSLPHSMPSDRKFVPGDLVLVDFGVRVSGYVCDITRMISVGRPSDEIKSFHSIVKWAQTEASSLIKPGAKVSDVDAASRAVFDGAGLGEFFVHGAGHGIGLSVHEPPSLNASSEAVLADGDVIAVEPGFYRPGCGGMRLEDDFLVTPGGSECLTSGLNGDLFVIE